jgi:two-component system, cell cycle response regulator DivK
MARKILLVEDHPDNMNIYRLVLEHFGYAVVAAADGKAALRQAREGRPDLILMDISIPFLDGWEVTAILKADGETRDIPIVALTAHAMDADRERAEAAGFDGFLSKPVEPGRLVTEVARFLDPPTDEGSSPSQP